MKSTSLILLILTLLDVNHLLAQVTPNSNRFEVKNYIAIDNTGEYSPYFAHGFYENTGSETSSKIFMMPILEFDLDHIKYIDSQGMQTSSSSQDVYSISIPIKAELSLPNESQKAAIGASLNSGTTLSFFIAPIAKNNMGGPLISPSAGIFTTQIMAQANQYEQEMYQQQQYIDAYNTYTPQLISLSEYEVMVKVGNDVVYDQRFPGTYISVGNSLDNISIDEPSVYVKNRIAGGNFSMLVKYKFKDSRNSYINANLNASLIINQFLSEAQQSVISQKSSGWSFLGFGSRRKSIKSYFDQQVNQQYSDQRFSSTTIEMYDANDQMIEMFENAFFPRLTQQKAIDNHIAAAEKARQSGNTQLEQLHMDYVRALQDNDPDLEVNIGAAAAALARKDYVGFIANGVRWGKRSATGNNSFRRVLNSSEMTQMQSQWSQTRTISVQHAVSQKVTPSKDVNVRPFLGLANGIPYQGNHYITNGYYTNFEPVRGIIIGPITANGPLHRNNVLPGTLLTRVGSRSVTSAQSLERALDVYNPGDRVTITIIKQVGPNVFQRDNITVELQAYPKAL